MDIPGEAKEKFDWVDLHALGLSLLDGTPKLQAELVETTRKAVQIGGFLLFNNLGITESQLGRHFALARYHFFHGSIGQDEKDKLLWYRSKGTF
ncbi:hypothetical protein FDECE_14591 [Fusarium decemcellulare]|nr:hypothetical protein FDECE_14591 [Fusarium decemcellulare]